MWSLGAPVCGALIDRAGASWGFLAAGAVGAVVAGGGLVVLRVARTTRRAEAPSPSDDVGTAAPASTTRAGSLPADVAPAEPDNRVPAAPLG